MAIEVEKAKAAIIGLATTTAVSGDTQYTAARNKLDALLAQIENRDEGKDILRAINASLKVKGKDITYILKGDVIKFADHILKHDAFGETMEADYYWILDFLREARSCTVDKSADFFAASEASGYFGELGGKRTALERQAIELIKSINFVVKSIINLLYDLKLFDLRLKNYDDLKNSELKETAMNGLKGIWLTEVDQVQKGAGSINSMAQNLSFITLRDAFMATPVQSWYAPGADAKKLAEAKSKAEKHASGMDLPDIVKRVLGPRTQEFIDWLYMSEKELRNRLAVEKAYLKAQVASLKVYASWVRPYLIGAQKLIPAEYKDLLSKHKELGLGPHAAPTPFHAIWMYLELFATQKAEIKDTRMPGYREVEVKLEDENNRPYAVVEVQMAFRGAPVTATGAKGERGYAHTGKKVFRSGAYIMQKKHIDLLQSFKDDEVLQFIDTMTNETFNAMRDDLNKYLEEKPAVEEKKPKAELPFAKWVKDAFGSIRKFNEAARALLPTLPKLKMGDNEAWKVARLTLVASQKAKKTCYLVHDVYKLSHGMLSMPTGYSQSYPKGY